MRRAALLWLVVFAAYAATVGLPASAGRDLSEPEAQTLLVAESIVSDHDLDLRDEYGAREWRSFYSGDLAPRVPRRFSAGTRQSVKVSGRVSDAFQPILR